MTVGADWPLPALADPAKGRDHANVLGALPLKTPM